MPYHPHLPARKIRLGDYTTGIPGETSSADDGIYQPAMPIEDVLAEFNQNEAVVTEHVVPIETILDEFQPIYNGGELPPVTTVAKASASSWKSMIAYALLGTGSIIAGSYVKGEGKYGIAAKIAFLGGGAYGIYRAYQEFKRVFHEADTSGIPALSKPTAYAVARGEANIDTFLEAKYISLRSFQSFKELYNNEVWLRTRRAGVPEGGLTTEAFYKLYNFVNNAVIDGAVPESLPPGFVALIPEYTAKYPDPR